jgi:hypothetical protein
VRHHRVSWLGDAINRTRPSRFQLRLLAMIVATVAVAGCHSGPASRAQATPNPPPSIRPTPLLEPTGDGDSRIGSPVLGYLRYVEFNGHTGHPRPSVKSGWGDFRPVSIDYEGDGTASFARVRWSSWGQPTAYGHGVSVIFAPQGGHVEVRGELRASLLGQCHGRRAYEHVDYRLFFVRGTNLYRHYGKTSGQWYPYGFPQDHGNVCRASRVLF